MVGSEMEDGTPPFSNVQRFTIRTQDTAVLNTAEGRPTGRGFPTVLSEISAAESRPLRTVGDFIMMLDTLKVPGPLTIIDSLDTDHQIGEGGQFIVYRNVMLDDGDNAEETWLDRVAVKKCRFGLEQSGVLDLSSPKYREQVHNMRLEVAALQDSRLRNHPNVVSLLGYGVEMRTFHETPFLVMDLALGDLGRALKEQLPLGVQHQLCVGVGYGLDAIHDCQLVHGDLKPQNVLVFESQVVGMPLIAKLADFGLSIDEVATGTDIGVMISGYSPGWEAPEITRCVETGRPISVTDLLSADRYAFGLLILSAVCFGGNVPPVHSYRTSEALQQALSGLPLSMSYTYEIAVQKLLSHEPEDRPSKISTLLLNETAAAKTSMQARLDYESWKARQEEHMSKDFTHPWKLPSLAALSFMGLEKSYRAYSEELTGGQLFAMFLLLSVHGITNAGKSLQVEVLLHAARKGFTPAQGVAQRVISSYGMSADHPINDEEAEVWLESAVGTGLRPTVFEIDNMTPSSLERSLTYFRYNSGYNQFYSPIANSDALDLGSLSFMTLTTYNDAMDEYGNTMIHQLTSYGNLRDLAALLKVDAVEINKRNNYGETALYKACLGGHSKVVLLLCQKGADAAITTRERAITCLHWLFGFPEPDIAEITSALVDAGADLDARIRGTVSVTHYHFPFRWPPGTPLHWAVAASSLAATKALLELGADPRARNKSDPYKADDNVRQLHVHGNGEQGEYSKTPETCLGLNSVDLAVANHEWRILEVIRNSYQGNVTTLFEVDEEGYSPFHRLSLNWIGFTSHGLRFWYRAFQGSTATRKDSLNRTIQVLKDMGGDINKLTNDPSKPGVVGARGGLSPLMIAVTKSDHEAVEVFCGQGADVNMHNREIVKGTKHEPEGGKCGRTALTMILDLHIDNTSPPRSIAAIVGILIKHGAKVNYQSTDGVTPLLCISSGLDLEALRILADNGVSMTDRKGLLGVAQLVHGMRHDTSLTHANKTTEQSEEREKALSKFFKEYIAPIAASNPRLMGVRTKTLLHCCVSSALFACVQFFLDSGASPNIIEDLETSRSVDGYTIGHGQTFHLTPLDVVEQTRQNMKLDGYDRLSQEKKEFIIGKLDKIRDMLLQKGGMRFTELQLSDLPLTATAS